MKMTMKTILVKGLLGLLVFVILFAILLAIAAYNDGFDISANHRHLQCNNLDADFPPKLLQLLEKGDSVKVGRLLDTADIWLGGDMDQYGQHFRQYSDYGWDNEFLIYQIYNECPETYWKMYNKWWYKCQRGQLHPSWSVKSINGKVGYLSVNTDFHSKTRLTAQQSQRVFRQCVLDYRPFQQAGIAYHTDTSSYFEAQDSTWRYRFHFSLGSRPSQ